MSDVSELVRRASTALPQLIGEIGAGTLLRCLVLAVVVVTPYGLYQRRRVRQLRAANTPEAASEPVEQPSANALEGVVQQLESIAAQPERADAAIELPSDLTVDGRPIAPDVADLLVIDAARRCGLTVIDRKPTPTGTLLRVRRA